MNKTTNINLAGFVHSLDENAYDSLKKYLSEVRASLKNTEGIEDIMYDIEQRIAEIFKSRLQGREVIIQSDIDEVIRIMGKPESYAEENEEEQTKSQDSSTHTAHQKRLFRDPENKYVAGVCGGLAVYFGVDAIWIRILTLILAIFFTPRIPLFLGYVIFWILVPYAKTTAEKLQMHGKPVNFDTIKKSFEKRSASAGSKLKNITSRGANILEKIAQTLSKWSIVALSSLIIFGGLILISSWSFFLFHNLKAYFQPTDDAPFSNLLVHSFDSTSVYFLSILSISLLILIPAIIGILLGIKLLHQSLQLKKPLMISLAVLWCMAAISSLMLSYTYIDQFSYNGSTKKTVKLEPLKDELTIVFNRLPDESTFGFNLGKFIPGLILLHNHVILPIEVSFKRSNNNSVYAEIIRSSQGNSQTDALEKTQTIQYQYRFDPNTSTIYFDDFSGITPQTPFRYQSVKLQIYLPKGQNFKMKNWKSHRFYHTEGRWRMARYGLECISPGCPYQDNDDDDDDDNDSDNLELFNDTIGQS